MTVCYFDVDDEVTGAVSRLRASEGPLVTLVLPAGSRIATSRINFLILEREARARTRTLAIVSSDAGVRALAVSAGLPAYPSVDEAELTLSSADASPPSLLLPGSEQVRSSESRAAEPPRTQLTAGRPSGGRTITPHSAASDARSTAAGTRTARRAWAAEEQVLVRALVRRRLSLGVRLLVVLGTLAAIAGAAYLYLPTATIALTPRMQAIGPVSVTVVAGGRVLDPAQRRVPAERVDLPLMVSGGFPATGTAVSQTRATGTVRFTSENTLNDVTIPAGTRITTASGVAFTTRVELVVPRASFAAGPTTRDVAVQAAQAGPPGNVAAGAITRVPDTLRAQLIAVRNAQATSGGRRAEVPEVAATDYDAALQQLTARLDEQLATALADPAKVPPGLTIHPATAAVVDVRPDRASADVVGTRGTSFTLTVSATGTVLGVDRSLIVDVAVDELKRAVPAGFRVLDDTIATSVGDPVVESDTLRYTVEARGLQWRPVDAATIVTAVRGRSMEEARTTLEQYGRADVSHWPEFLDTMPTQDSRITVAVQDPAAP